jgi:heptosyltransferase III
MNAVSITSSAPRFLVFRNGLLGNTLLAEPLFRALKKLYPNCYLAVVVDDVGSCLLKKHPQVDELFLLNRKCDSLLTQWSLVRTFRARRFDISLHLRTGVRNELLAMLGGVPQRVGLRLNGSWQFLTHVQLRRPQLHVLAELTAFATEALGREVVLDAPKLYPDAQAGAKVEAFLDKHGLKPGGYIAVHLGGMTCRGVDWGPDVLSPLVAKLHEHFGLAVVLVGTFAEREAATRMWPEGPGVVHAFSFPLDEFLEIIRCAAAFLGTDSGPAHVAEAWGVPKVVVYANGQDNFSRWRPLNEERCLPLFREQFNQPGVEDMVLNWLAPHISL